MFGRSLFESPEPLVLMNAVRDMVHDDVSFEDAVARLSPVPAGHRRRNSACEAKDPTE